MPTAHELLKRAERLRWNRQFDEALELLEEAVRLAENDGPSQLLADCLSWLGLVESLKSQAPESLQRAKQLHERALEIEQALHGEQHARVAETLRLLGGTLDQLGRPEDAYAALTRSVSISKALGTVTRSVLDALARLSDVAFELGRYDEAAGIAEEYLALPLADPLSDLEEMAGRIRAGRALLEADRSREAVTHFERGLAVATARGRERGISEMSEWLSKARDRTSDRE